MPKTREFDAAEYLDSPEMIAEYLTEALETDDEVFIAKAIGTIARAGNGRRRRQRRRLPGKSLSSAQRQHPAGIRDNPQGAGSARRAAGGEAASGLMHKLGPLRNPSHVTIASMGFASTFARSSLGGRGRTAHPTSYAPAIRFHIQ